MIAAVPSNHASIGEGGPAGPLSFQDLILTLERYWADHGALVVQPWDVEKGAGTFNPATF